MTPPHTTKEPSTTRFSPAELRALSPELALLSDEQILAVQDQVLTIKAQQKAAQLERQREGIRRKIETGQHYGTAPLGYINRREGSRTWIEPDKNKEFAMKLAFTLHATGKLSIREISQEVAKHGLVGKDGKPLLPGTLWRMLKSKTESGSS